MKERLNYYIVYENGLDGFKKQESIKKGTNVIPLLYGVDGRKGVHAFVDFEDIVDEPQDSPLYITKMAEALRKKANESIDKSESSFRKLLKKGDFQSEGDPLKYCAFVDIKKDDLKSDKQQEPRDFLITKLTEIVMKTDENDMRDIRFAWSLLLNSSGFKETNEQAKGAVYVVFRVDNSLKRGIMKAGLPQVFENVFVHQDALSEKTDELYNEIDELYNEKEKYINENKIEDVLDFSKRIDDFSKRVESLESNFKESIDNTRLFTDLKQKIESLQNVFKEKGTGKSR